MLFRKFNGVIMGEGTIITSGIIITLGRITSAITTTITGTGVVVGEPTGEVGDFRSGCIGNAETPKISCGREDRRDCPAPVGQRWRARPLSSFARA